MLGRFLSNIGLLLLSFALDYNGGILTAIPTFDGSIHSSQLFLVLIGTALRIHHVDFHEIVKLCCKFILPVCFLILYHRINERSIDYGTYKYELLVWSIAIIGCLVLTINSTSSFRTLILLGIIQMSISILFSGLDPSEFRTGVGSPITASRIGGFLILALIFATWIKLGVRLIFGLLGITVLLISGTRTPLIALALLIGINFILPILKKRRIRKPSVKSSSRVIFLLCLIGIFIVINPFKINTKSIERTLSAFQSLGDFANSDGSTKERILEWNMAIEAWYDHPIIGGGTGQFGFLWFGYDRAMYPHNFLLELLCENGLIGLLLIVIWIITTIPKRDTWSFPETKFSVFVFVYSFIIGLSSLDFPNQFMLFLSLAFLLISSKLYEKNSLHSKE